MSRTIATILTLSDRMSGGILKASSNIQTMSREMRTATNQSVKMATNFKNNVDKMTDKLVKFTALAGIAGAGIVLKVGLEGLKELDDASAKVKSIALDALSLKDIKSGLLSASNKTGVDVKTLGDTQYDAISSGVSPTESLDASLVSAKLAKAGFTDSNSALKVLMATMNVYGLTGTKSMQSIADKMMVVQNLGVITVAEMAESMGSVTPIAQAAGASLDELDAGIISLTKNGIKADEASVEMKGIFTSILSPTAEASKAAKDLGIDFSASALKAKGFAGFMSDIKDKTGGSTEKIASLFGNVRALTGAVVLSGVGFKDFNEGLVAVKDSAGMTDKAFAITNNTIGAKWDKLKNQFKNTCTAIVDTQSGAMGKLADQAINWLTDNQANIQKWTDNIGKGITEGISEIKKIIDFLIRHKEAIINFGIAFASFAFAIKVAKGLTMAINLFKFAFVAANGALAVSPIGWVIIGITLLVAGFILLYKNSAVFRNEVAFVIGKLQQFGSYAMTNLVPILGSIATTLIAKVSAAFNYLYPIISNFTTTILIPLVRFLTDVFQVAFSIAFPFILSVISNVFNIISGIIQGGIQIFGGLLEFITGIFSGNWSLAWKGITDIFGGIFNNIKVVASGVLNGIISNINLVIRGINKISSAGGFFGKGLSIPEIPAFANGTSSAPGGLSLVGERGPELVNLRKGDSITTADKTKKVLSDKSGHTFIINFNGNVGSEDFFDEAAEKICEKILTKLNNM